jgi:hypothetical protein
LAGRSRARIGFWLVAATLLLPVACGSTTVSPSPAASFAGSPGLASASARLPTSSEQAASATTTAIPSGFVFESEDIAAYYETQGYTCVTPQPSTTAAGFMFRTCQKTDDAGRTQSIGLVTDTEGNLANAFASVKGTDTETFLAPIDALDPLSGFLGATLGEEQGTALLTWLASHLGDTFAETMSGQLKVATYTESQDDHSALYVEVANQAYLDAPPARSP